MFFVVVEKHKISDIRHYHFERKYQGLAANAKRVKMEERMGGVHHKEPPYGTLENNSKGIPHPHIVYCGVGCSCKTTQGCIQYGANFQLITGCWNLLIEKILFGLKYKDKAYIANRKRKRAKSQTTLDDNGAAETDRIHIQCSQK